MRDQFVKAGFPRFPIKVQVFDFDQTIDVVPGVDFLKHYTWRRTDRDILKITRCFNKTSHSICTDSYLIRSETVNTDCRILPVRIGLHESAKADFNTVNPSIFRIRFLEKIYLRKRSEINFSHNSGRSSNVLNLEDNFQTKSTVGVGLPRHVNVLDLFDEKPSPIGVGGYDGGISSIFGCISAFDSSA